MRKTNTENVNGTLLDFLQEFPQEISKIIHLS